MATGKERKNSVENQRTRVIEDIEEIMERLMNRETIKAIADEYGTTPYVIRTEVKHKDSDFFKKKNEPGVAKKSTCNYKLSDFVDGLFQGGIIASTSVGNSWLRGSNKEALCSIYKTFLNNPDNIEKSLDLGDTAENIRAVAREVGVELSEEIQKILDKIVTTDRPADENEYDR